MTKSVIWQLPNAILEWESVAGDAISLSIWSSTIKVLIDQDLGQILGYDKGFKQKKCSFLIKNLHLLLDILHTVLPSRNTCQLYNKTLQFHYQYNYLPDTRQIFVRKLTTKRTDKITK